MKTLVLVLCAALSLVSCKSFNGTLSVDEKLTLKKAFNKKVTISEGQYNATLKIVRKNAYLKIGGKKFKFKAPKGYTLPHSGDFAIEASKKTQGYGLEGHIDTVVRRGDLRRDFESCTVSIPRTVCRTVNGRTSCHTTHYNRHGVRRVVYRVVTTAREFIVNMTKDQRVAATFDGTNRDYHRDYEYYGTCR